MKRKTVKSSNIKSVGYNIDKRILELEFPGGIYYYLDVDLKTVVEFIFAESLGQYFHNKIKNKFSCKKGEYNV